MNKVCRPGDYFDSVSAAGSIFLAGPSPRDEFGKEWRDWAVQILELESSCKKIFYPSPFITSYSEKEMNYYFQIEWEARALEVADVILFWVPRELEHMPGFTTNVEFGEWHRSGKVVYGRPSDAPKTGYLDWKAKRYNVPIRETLPETVASAVSMLKMKKGLA